MECADFKNHSVYAQLLYSPNGGILKGQSVREGEQFWLVDGNLPQTQQL